MKMARLIKHDRDFDLFDHPDRISSILHFSDLHASAANLDKCRMVLDQIIAHIVTHEAQFDFVLFTGDWWDGRQYVTESSAYHPMMEKARELAYLCPLVILQGTSTHDLRGSLEEFKHIDHCVVLDRPEPFKIGFKNSHYLILPIPAMTKAHLIGQQHDLSLDAANKMISQKLNEMMLLYKMTASDFRKEAADELLDSRMEGRESEIKNPIVITAGHLSTIGAKITNEQTMPATDIAVSPDSLSETEADYIGLGHIHKRQQVGNYRSFYAGSPFQMNFGEADQVKKGWLDVHFFDSKESVDDIFGFNYGVSEEDDRKVYCFDRTVVAEQDAGLPALISLNELYQFEEQPDGQIKATHDLIDSDGEPLTTDKIDLIEFVRSWKDAHIKVKVYYDAQYGHLVSDDHVRESLNSAVDAMIRLHGDRHGRFGKPASIQIERKPIKMVRERCPEIKDAESNKDMLELWGKATGTDITDADLYNLNELERKVANDQV